MSYFVHIFLCTVLKLLEIPLQVRFAIRNTFAISQCHNVILSPDRISLSQKFSQEPGLKIYVNVSYINVDFETQFVRNR